MTFKLENGGGDQVQMLDIVVYTTTGMASGTN